MGIEGAAGGALTVADLWFDPATHTYTYDRRPVVGASELLRDAGLSVPPPCSPAELDAASRRGTLVHMTACAVLKNQRLPGGTLSPYLPAVMRAIDDLKLSAVAAEVSVSDGLMAGTVDYLGRCYYAGTWWPWAVIDWKSGAAAASHRLQTRIYARLVARDKTAALPEESAHAIAAAAFVARLVVFVEASGDYWVDPHNIDPATGQPIPSADVEHDSVIGAALVLRRWHRKTGRT